MSPELSWKDQYLRELDAAEHREQQWQQHRTLLERMLVRTSLGLKGQSGELDQLLDNVRDQVRSPSIDVEHWELLQTKIDCQMVLLEQAEVASQGSGASPAAGSMDLGRDGDRDRLRIARRVGQLVEQIVSDIPISADAEKKARALQQILLYSEDWSVLRKCLRDVAELVMMAIKQCRAQFDEFIQQLDDRLAVLRQSFVAHTSAQSGRLSASEALGQDLQGGLKRLSQHIQSSNNLYQLKHSVTGHLDDIAQSVVQFRKRESDREKALATQLEALQQKIVTMETESELMREQVLKERRRANTDMLTQLPNRDSWHDRLQLEVERWQRYKGEMTIAIVDIDLFKRINDSYGHKAGDRVLQLLARELKKGLRSTDFIARIGGEEFVVLLPETTGIQAKQVIDGLRASVAKLPFHCGNQPVTITFSAGIASIRSGDDEDTLFERADRTLYIAKNAGRNQVKISTD
ncbi:MAG: diguanylate cyclase [Marinobacter psychrophilus]|jgi:diguanylate cyclase|uniref:GGDEF domain-containing protein n=1 Tax=Marinobacter psychrophilus TaxID=330734 RepID=UPI0039E395CD